MHKIKLENKNLRTDLITDQINDDIKTTKKEEKNGIIILNSESKTNKYTTIFFKDITDKDAFMKLQKVLENELKKYIKPNKQDKILVIGLGNEKSTPDSLGPETLNHILVTRYLFLLGDVSEKVSNVSILKPDVIGNTGIESIDMIKCMIDQTKPTIVIAIDSLKANKMERLVKTVQITDSGIHPGSGIYNNRGELSKNTMNCDVIAIGVPTVVDIDTIKNKNTEENFIVTPTNIDFLIEKLSYLLGNSLNHIFHKTFFDK